ncbi:hypothetical protein L873DRAFT_1794652 [Choiromyces venosus 120613-1]|uniref:Uncharacterized protein n=1 Tax=Choiromyces venosus 120613-1 TaxID=1336337 RepID=A0A3N4J5V4_9PEZI|nr:hypothetical protein L873DRAFT_1794652 [Choiromyces venosus 120613-1]
MGVTEFIEMCKDIEETNSINYSDECSGIGQVTSRESLESSRLLSSKITGTPITPNLISREKPLPTTIEILTSSPQLPASSISTGILDSDMQGLGLLIYEEVIQVTPTILGEAEITGYGASSTCSSLLQQDPTQATLPLDIQFDTTQGISCYDKNDQKLSCCAALTSNSPRMVSSSCSATPLSPISKSVGTTKDKSWHPNKLLVQKPKVTSTAVYITGMPYSPISQVKKVLGAAPIGIQLQHIRNISWIDGRILEVLVDPNHVDRMRNRIGKYSEYYVSTTFDPLSPDSFNWKGEVLPESQESILKTNFIQRLGASVASSSRSTTREHIMEWARNHGLESQLRDQLHKQGIRFSHNCDQDTAHSQNKNDQDTNQCTKTTVGFKGTAGAAKYTSHKRKLSCTDSMQR